VGSTQTIQFRTPDGWTLDADLSVPEGATRGGVVVCHPHPLYGGNRHNVVVDAVFGALPPAGFAALRFDFRAVHRPGSNPANGDHRDLVDDAVTDAATALDELARHVGAAPSFLVGYSFGAVVSLCTHDARVAGIAAIAPPLGLLPIDRSPEAPVLVLSPRHDQFCPPEVAATAVESWPQVELEPVESADHFLAGHTASLAARAVAWLSALAP
jgi:alpha/beta superfamily hydrolase